MHYWSIAHLFTQNYSFMTFDPINVICFLPTLLIYLFISALRLKRHWPLVALCISGQFSIDSPQMTPSWPSTPSMCGEVRCSSYQIWSPWSIQIIWPVVDPDWPLHDLRPQQCIALWSRILLPNRVATMATRHSWAIWPLLDPSWPLHDLRPHQYTTRGQGLFLPNLDVKRHP